MDTIDLKVHNVDVFIKTLKTVSSFIGSSSSGVKLTFNSQGLTIYVKTPIARCNITSNSISTNENVGDISFCVSNISTFIKTISTAYSFYKDTESFSKYVKLCYQDPFILIKSKQIKTKLTTISEDIITSYVDKKFGSNIENFDFEITTNLENLHRISSHDFIVTDPSNARVYIEGANLEESDSNEPSLFGDESNVAYATISSTPKDGKSNLNSEIRLPFGIVISGSIDKNIVLNLEKFDMFSINKYPNNGMISIKRIIPYNVLLIHSEIVSDNSSSSFDLLMSPLVK